MAKPWYTLTVVTACNLEQVGIGIRAQGPAKHKGRYGPLLMDFECAMDGTHCAATRAALRALQLAHEKRWDPVRIRLKDRDAHRRLKRLLKGHPASCDEASKQFLELASNFEEVAIRRILRGKGATVKALARQAAGLPPVRKKKRSETDYEPWFDLYFEMDCSEEGEFEAEAAEWDEIPF